MFFLHLDCRAEVEVALYRDILRSRRTPAWESSPFPHEGNTPPQREHLVEVGEGAMDDLASILVPIHTAEVEVVLAIRFENSFFH